MNRRHGIPRVNGLTEPGLNKVIREGYRLLNLITYLTAGPKESRAWTVKRGSTAPEAAGVIHTDFQRGFIKAEVTHWKDLVDLGSEAAVKSAGKMRMEGKEYIVVDGDVIHFLQRAGRRGVTPSGVTFTTDQPSSRSPNQDQYSTVLIWAALKHLQSVKGQSWRPSDG